MSCTGTRIASVLYVVGKRSKRCDHVVTNCLPEIAAAVEHSDSAIYAAPEPLGSQTDGASTSGPVR